MQQPNAHPYIGHQLGDYRLIRSLGRGGFAEVYLGEHIHHSGEFAAVKVLTSLDNMQNAARFQEEIAILRSLHHQYIVRILDSGVQQGVPFLVMEYMPNGSLERLPKPFAFATTLYYVQAIASALQYAHNHVPQVIHCDVKPGNILLGNHGEVKLTDFNVALRDYHTHSPSLDYIIGTYTYMAPEQFRGHPTRRSDQYALAAVVYEWLCGRPPFDGRTYEQLSHQHQFEAPVPLYRIYRKDTAILRSLSNVVMRALEKDEHQRYSDVGEFAAALEREMDKQMDIRTEAAPLVGPQSDATSSSLYPRPAAMEHARIEEQRTLMRDIQQITRTTNDRLRELEEQREEQKATAFQHERQQIQEIARTRDGLLQDIHTLEQEVEMSLWYSSLGRSMVGASRTTRLPGMQTLAGCRTQFRSINQEISTLLQRASDMWGNYSPWMLIAGCASIIIGAFLGGSVSAFFHTDGVSTFLWTLILCLLATIAIPTGLLINDFYRFQHACVRFRRMSSYVNAAYTRQERQLTRERERAYTASDQEYAIKLQEHVDAVQQQFPSIQQRLTEISHRLGTVGIAWDDPLWQNWQAVDRGAEPIARLGTFSLSVDERIRSVLSWPAITLPALIGYGPGMNLLIETNGENAEKQAVSAIETLIVRLLATQPPYMLHFTIIDPSDWTNNLATFAHNKHHEQRQLLGLDKTFIRREQAQQALSTLLDTIDTMMNNNAQPVPEEMPHHFLILLDFPSRLQEGDLYDILDIMQRGPRYGISTIIVNTFAHAPSSHFAQKTEHLITANIISNGATFMWHDEQYQAWSFTFDDRKAVPSDLFDVLFDKIVMAIQPITSCEHNVWFNELIQGRNTRPLPQPGEAGKLWLGHSLRTREPAAVQLYRAQTHNLLIVGQPAGQETTLGMFTTAMIGLTIQYPAPEAVRFLAIDLNMHGKTLYHTHPLAQLQRLFSSYIPTAGVLLSESTEEQCEQFWQLLDSLTDVSITAAKNTPITSYVFISGLYRMNATLLKREMQAMRDYLTQLKERLEFLYRYGYRYNVYLILACDTYEEFVEVFSENGIACFGHRLVFRTLSAKVSQILLDNDEAIALAEGQACLYSLVPQRGTREHIYPYTLPSQKWLEGVAQELQQE